MLLLCLDFCLKEILLGECEEYMKKFRMPVGQRVLSGTFHTCFWARLKPGGDEESYAQGQRQNPMRRVFVQGTRKMPRQKRR
jgi:hypothetical protein